MSILFQTSCPFKISPASKLVVTHQGPVFKLKGRDEKRMKDKNRKWGGSLRLQSSRKSSVRRLGRLRGFPGNFPRRALTKVESQLITVAPTHSAHIHKLADWNKIKHTRCILYKTIQLVLTQDAKLYKLLMVCAHQKRIYLFARVTIQSKCNRRE